MVADEARRTTGRDPGRASARVKQARLLATKDAVVLGCSRLLSGRLAGSGAGAASGEESGAGKCFPGQNQWISTE